MKARAFYGVLSVLVWLSARGEVAVFDTHGASDEVRWTRVQGTPAGLDPRHIVIENGLVRLRYPARKADADSGFHPLSERAAHLLYLRLGGAYQLVQDAELGDWTYVSGAFDDAPTSFALTENSPAVCTAVLDFADHRMTATDCEQPNAPAPVTKTVTLRRDEYGYVANIRIGSTLRGEREVGFGGSRTHLFNYTASVGQRWELGRNDEDGCCNYQFPKRDGVSDGDSWAVGFAPSDGYYRLVAISHDASVALRFAQFRTADPANPGIVGNMIHYTTQGLREFEAYIAAVPYDGSSAAQIEEGGDAIVVHAPADGTYSVFSNAPRASNPGCYIPIIREVYLRQGANRIAKPAAKLVRPLVVPISNGRTFPADIAAVYQTLAPR